MAAIRAMLIDEDHDLHKVFCFKIKQANMLCFCAYSGKEGLEKAAKEKPDVIVLSLQMKNMDGIEVAQKLQENETTKNIPIIFLVESSDFDRSKLPKGPTIKFLIKPCDFSKLQKEIQELAQTK